MAMKAKLHIQAACRGDKTYLKKAFCTQPFKVADITEDKRANPLRLMLMSSSPGILDGDDYQLKLELAEGCCVDLQTQSYQRLFTMKQGAGATQRMRVDMATGSSLCYLPHPSVPHEQSSFMAANDIYLSDACSLIWGEVLTCGRKLNGEVFRFATYQSVTQIFINQKLRVKENLLVRPSVMAMQAIGQMEGFTHQASLIYLNEQAPISKLSDQIVDYLSQQADVLFGISEPVLNGLVVRILGHRAEQLHSCLKTIAGLLPQTVVNHPKSVPYAS